MELFAKFYQKFFNSFLYIFLVFTFFYIIGCGGSYEKLETNNYQSQSNNDYKDHIAQDSELSAVYDDQYLLRMVKVDNEASRYSFEVCDVDFLAAYGNNSCVAAYIDKKGKPVVFHLKYEDQLANEVSHNLSDSLTQLQKNYKDSLNSYNSNKLAYHILQTSSNTSFLAASGMLGLNGIYYLNKKQIPWLSANPALKQFFSSVSNFVSTRLSRKKLFIGSAIASFIGVVFFVFKNYALSSAYDAREEAIEARIKYGGDLTQDFLEQFKDLSNLLMNWSYISTPDPSTTKHITGTKDLVADFGAFMRNMLNLDMSLSLDRYCVPANKLFFDKTCYKITNVKLKD